LRTPGDDGGGGPGIETAGHPFAPADAREQESVLLGEATLQLASPTRSPNRSLRPGMAGHGMPGRMRESGLGIPDHSRR
jgi:hypothetical protein